MIPSSRLGIAQAFILTLAIAWTDAHAAGAKRHTMTPDKIK